MTYDPLYSLNPANQGWPDSYWASTVKPSTDMRVLGRDRRVDVAIIGGGYTGLLTAYYLVSLYGIDCCVLEANQIGFGASGRNAGFVLKGSGRLSYPQMHKKWGMEVTKGIYLEFTDAVTRVEQLIHEQHIDCEKQASGYLKIAHNPKAFEKLRRSSAFITAHLGEDATLLSNDELKAAYMDNRQACGALRLADGFGVNPLKLLLGYRSMLDRLGVDVYESSCVLQWKKGMQGHHLITENGSVLAKQVISAGNAYTPKVFQPEIDERFLPILSNIIVTEPLSAEQLKETGLMTHQVIMDTRLLKYYYRLLPDNRLLFGGRGAVSGKAADQPIYGQHLKRAMSDCFPCLADCAIEYNWTGWIAAALDDMPHVFQRDGMGYSLGYCGAGVAFSAQAAFRLAQSLAGETLPALPLYQQPLSRFPYARFRRLGQRGYYHYAWLKDRYF
ncbi:FAD-binding oxidoreductase [Shewanella sp. AS1]|uniref:NAD(P)/FAD-dependent oxidoreductase n=1 Tax=Shewanella sp. AS1 TaxID=2907626 RepID=UPI001F3C1D87|nr:FAD-binding oxidoreductase [Shewanella sp. AS1]MCE9678472.1 FAD-binding oxidoreductase [Shewanella sp. AS1]